MFSTRTGAARLSLMVVSGLVIIKIVVATLTGSISVLAQAADSFLDVLAVVITFFLMRVSTKPADKEHPFGHGKVENIAAITQALLLFIAGISLIYSSIERIINGETLEMAPAGIGVMAVSMVVSILLSRHLRKVAQQDDSPALSANAYNIATDVYSAAVIMVGLIIVNFTGLTVIDPLLAILVSLYIMWIGLRVIRESSPALIDEKLPDSEESIIKSTIMDHGAVLTGFHALRTRKAGSQRYIDLHLVMPRNASVEQAHGIVDHIEQDIKKQLPHTSVMIHTEPCSDECEECGVKCNLPDKGHHDK